MGKAARRWVMPSLKLSTVFLVPFKYTSMTELIDKNYLWVVLIINKKAQDVLAETCLLTFNYRNTSTVFSLNEQ